jgi:Family of unknown function (DUF6311)
LQRAAATSEPRMGSASRRGLARFGGWAELVAMAIGLTWILARGGASIIDPRKTSWLMCGDWSWHHLGWLYYQRDEWRFPLGMIPNYPHPFGSVTGYTDSIPWVALLLKLLPLPDGEYQYLGPYIVLSFILSGYWGARLVRLFASSTVEIVLGALPFIVTPILLMRTGHAALTAHWLILWALHLYLRPSSNEGQVEATVLSATLLGFVVAGVHPYLMAMTVPILLALLWRLYAIDRALEQRAALIALAQVLGATAATLFTFGYLNGTGPGGGGYGTFVADLLTFVNSMGYSRIVPQLPSRPGEIEGFGYLGLGVLTLLGYIAIAGRNHLSQVPWKRLRPLLVVSAVLFVYALSVRVTVAGHVLFDTEFTFFTIAKIFQSSGRFIWPSYYLLVLLAVVGTLRLTAHRARVGSIALGVAGLLQVVEQAPGATRFGRDAFPIHVPQSEIWNLARGSYRHMKLFPPPTRSKYKPDIESHAPVPLGYLALRNGMTIDLAVLARGSSSRRKNYEAQLAADVEAGKLEPDAMYIVWDVAIEDLRRIARCGVLDGYNVCVAAQNGDAFARALGAPAGR